MYYHIWFVTKYRKAVLEDKTEEKIKAIFAECIQRHNYSVLELETNRDHAHMLVEAKDNKELAGIVRTLKAVSAKEILSTPRFRVGNGSFGYYRRKPVEAEKHFWARRYGWKEVAQEDLQGIQKYIQEQKILHTEVCREKS